MDLHHIPDVARDAARSARRRLILGVAACGAVAVACGFATAAVYIQLATEVGASIACLAMALAYLLIAAIIIATSSSSLGNRSHSRRLDPDPRREDPMSHLVSTFLAGVRAGRGSGKR